MERGCGVRRWVGLGEVGVVCGGGRGLRCVWLEVCVASGRGGCGFRVWLEGVGVAWLGWRRCKGGGCGLRRWLCHEMEEMYRR